MCIAGIYHNPGNNMHHTSVSGTGTEQAKAGRSKGNRNRGKGRRRDNVVVENCSSVESPQEQQPVLSIPLKKALPQLDSCSQITTSPQVATLRGDSQEPTPVGLRSASKDAIPVVTSAKIHLRPPGVVTGSTGFTAKSSKEPLQGIHTLSNQPGQGTQMASGPVAGEGPHKIHSVDGPQHHDCDGGAADASPLIHPAKSTRKRKGKAKVKCHVNTSDATAQPNIDHLAPTTTPNLKVYGIHGPSPGDTSTLIPQSEGLNGDAADVPPAVDTAVGTEAGTSNFVSVNVNNSPNIHEDISTAAAVDVEVDSHGQAPTRPPKRRRRKPKAKDSSVVQTPSEIENSSESPTAQVGPDEGTAPAELMEPTLKKREPIVPSSHRHRTAETTVQSDAGSARSKATEGGSSTVDAGAPIVDTEPRSKKARQRLARKVRQNTADTSTSCDNTSESARVNIKNCEQQVSSQRSEQGLAPRSQYQHYIPCLVLRTFATAESRTLGGRRGALVNVYSLEDACITPTPVARCYGVPNMYQDISAEDEMHVEKALAVLEDLAARVIERVKQAQAKGAMSVILTRVEKNSIRKFLFVMKYRGVGFWAKYNHILEDYQHTDRDRVLKFMRERGFTKPIEVWLHTLKTILDTPIDPKDEWEHTISEKCFVLDGEWFIQNMNDFFLAFVQPKNPESEFILTDSAFGIHEGPTETILTTKDSTNGMTTEWTESSPGVPKPICYFKEFHKMAPFSPKLLLVLRSHLIMDEGRKERLRELADILPGPDSHQYKKPSAFDKLHLDFARQTYVDPGNFTNEDTFEFTLHKISDQDVWMFNSFFLEHVRENLTWLNNVAFKETLTEYLDSEKFLESQGILRYLGEEELRGHPDIKRREQLYRLLAILEGHQGKGAELPVPPLGSHISGMLEFEGRIPQSPLIQGYFKLGMFSF